MQPSDQGSLWYGMNAVTDPFDSYLSGSTASVCLGELLGGSCLGTNASELRGRSVLIWTNDQLAAALALIELDGIARRLVLCPADLPPAHLPFVIGAAGVDAIVLDGSAPEAQFPGMDCLVSCGPRVAPANYNRIPGLQTEWILLTSGTTGLPKLVVHTLSSLAGAIALQDSPPQPAVWSTFYDIRRYGGLRIFLRALLAGASMVLSQAGESTSDFLTRAGKHGVTHISGTPTHWRSALISPAAHEIAPVNVRLSGEVADQSILNQLKAFYPHATIVHAFASTEAGLAFEVADGHAGFPAAVIDNNTRVQVRITDGSLRIRSPLNASRYLGGHSKDLIGADGFVDTGDMLELQAGRYYFVGRRDGVINVGGLKVYPEEVEAVINKHPRVRMSLVRTRKNPITGALVVADVVLDSALVSLNGAARNLEHEILQECRGALPRHKVPTAIRFVSHLPVSSTGKVLRQPCATS